MFGKIIIEDYLDWIYILDFKIHFYFFFTEIVEK